MRTTILFYLISVSIVTFGQQEKIWIEQLENPKFSSDAGTLKAGLELVQKGDLDIVLLDLGLPDSQGLKALETILEQVNHFPVVVITGLDDGGTDNEKGTGFGMILCKDFVEKNNGSMKIESEMGKGTKISFELSSNNSS